MEIADKGFKDILVGTELFRTLDITSGDLASPIQEAKVREIATFLNEHPDPTFVIGLTRYNKNPNMSNLDFLSSYVKLEQKKTSLNNELKKVDKDLTYYYG